MLSSSDLWARYSWSNWSITCFIVSIFLLSTLTSSFKAALSFLSFSLMCLYLKSYIWIWSLSSLYSCRYLILEAIPSSTALNTCISICRESFSALCLALREVKTCSNTSYGMLGCCCSSCSSGKLNSLRPVGERRIEGCSWCYCVSSLTVL